MNSIDLMKAKVNSFKNPDNFVLEYCVVHILNDIDMQLSYAPSTDSVKIKRLILKHIKDYKEKLIDEIEFYPNVSFKQKYTEALGELNDLDILIEEQLL